MDDTEMDDSIEVLCVLCGLSEETDTTGPLLTKDEVTAHHNCLLFSSGIYCQSSPQFDDLFGFSVEDVQREVKRGKQLRCNRCNKRGATAGCEVGRCKKSYHYPCAVEDRAQIIEDTDQEKYMLYCYNHYQETPENSGSANGHPSSHRKSQTSKTPSEARSAKRRFETSDKQGKKPSKRKSKIREEVPTDDSSDSDVNRPDLVMAMFAPLETDLESCANSVTEPQPLPLQLIRKDTESPAVSASGSRPEEESGNESDETIIHADAESENLPPPVSQRPFATGATISTQTSPPAPPNEELVETEGPTPEQAPIQSPDQHTAGPSDPQQSPAGPLPSHDHSKPRSVTVSPPCTPMLFLPPSPSPSPPPPMGPPSDPEPTINATSFWRSCNAAGCTQAIFTGFMNEMKDISSRIQSDQASQEDYDLALTVMTASGKLAELVSKQQEAIQRKQVELQKVAAAMEKVVSTLRGVHQQLHVGACNGVSLDVARQVVCADWAVREDCCHLIGPLQARSFLNH